MERKIGEIFEYEGEWYQCINTGNCSECAFTGKRCYDFSTKGVDIIGDCTGRTFKKLEKVGEPFELQKRTIQTYRLYTEPFISVDMDFICTYLNGSNIIDIIIKRDIEDMEEKDLVEKLSEKVHNAWMKEKEAQGFSYGKEYDKEKKKHPDMLPYNELKEEVKEYDRVTVKAVLQAQKELSADANKLSFKEFNLEAAKSGKPVCTRDGRKARIICFDAKDTQPIIGLYEKNIDGIVREYLCSYHTDGRMYDDQDTGYDLMMLPEKKEGWVNVYDADTTFRFVEGMVYNTKDEAIQRAKKEVTNGLREKNEYVDTVKICWEE